MQQLNNLTAEADQSMVVTLPDGSAVQLEFLYRPGIERWSVDVVHPALTLRGYLLCQGYNILRPYKNVIPFGLAVVSSTGLDPMNPGDLQDGTITIYILSAAEVAQVESQLLAPVPLANA